jgi:apolipoprotein N-acyltransferase
MTKDKPDNPEAASEADTAAAASDAAPVDPPHVRPGELGGIFGAVGTPPLVLTTRPGAAAASRHLTGLHLAGRNLRMRISALTGLRRYGLAAVAGLLTAGAMAPLYLVPLLVIAFAALVWLVDGTEHGARGGRQAFAIGWVFGLAYFLGGVYWIGYSFLVDGETYAWMLPFAMVAMPVGLGLFTGTALALARLLWRPGPARVLVFAAAFAGLEWVRGHILTGFPWNLTGYAWGGIAEMMQAVSVVGIYGLSFLTIFAAASPAALFGPAQERGGWRWPVFAAMMIGVLWTAGGVRLYLAPYGAETYVEGVNLRIVQPNIPQADKWRPENRQAIWNQLLEQTAAPSSAPITHVIWPESAPPFVFASQPGERVAAGAALEPGGVLMTGALRVEREPGDIIHFYNGFHVASDTGAILGTYDKHHLVPFGEYLPLRALLGRLGFRSLVDERFDYRPGPGARTLTVPGAPDVGPLICYEAIFPGATVDPRRRPGWLVNVTDDSWFGDSSGPRQHLGLAQARAIEEGLPLVRAANTGISAVIDPYGRVLSRLDLNVRGNIDSPLPSALGPTFYAYVRDWPFLLTVLVLLGWAAWARRRAANAR